MLSSQTGAKPQSSTFCERSPSVSRCFFLLLVLILFLSAPLSALAAETHKVELTPEEQAWLAEHPDIVLAAATGYEPMVIKNADGTHVGMLVDLFEHISQALNTRIGLYVADSWADVQKKTRNGELDGLAFGASNPKRAALYNPTDIIFSSYPSIFARSQNEHQIKSFSDLNGMRIGYKKAAAASRALLETLPSATLKPYDNHESMTQALLSREIDVIAAWMSYDHWRKEKLQGVIDNILLVDHYPVDNVTYIRKDWPELIPILNKALATLRQDELPRIMHKWFGQWPEESTKREEKPHIALTDEERTWLDQGHTVRARVSDWPPLMFKEPELSGIAVDYLRTISERLGIHVKFVPDETGFQKGLQDLMGEHTHYDLFLSLKRTPEREETIAFTEDYMSMPWVIYSREDALFISGLEDLNGKTVSVEQGFFVAEILEKDYPSIRLLKVSTSLDALRAVATAQADAYIGNLSNATWLLRKHNLDNLKIAAPTPFGDIDSAMGVRSDWPELASILSKGLASMSPDEHKVIKDHWLTTYKAEFDYTLLWQILVGTGFVLIGIISWNRQLSRKVAARSSELSESESRFRAIFEQAAVGIAHVAVDGNFLSLNQKFCNIVGYSLEEMMLKTFQEITHADDLDKDLDLLSQLLNGTADTYTLEKRYLRKDSSVAWINLTVKVVRNSDHSPKWFVSVIEDISERKLAEAAEKSAREALHQSYDLLQNLLMTVPDAVFSIKIPERKVQWCNDSYAVLGYDPAECVGESTRKFYPSLEEADKVEALLDKAISSGEESLLAEVQMLRKNGEIFDAELNISVYRKNDKVISVTALARDISERRQAENKLLDYHSRLKALASELTMVEEQERRRIATDLHDNVGQSLALSLLQLAAAENSIDNAAVKGQFDEISQTLLSAVQDTQHLIFELSSPTMNDLGLGAAISEWVEQKVNPYHDIKVTVIDKHDRERLGQNQNAILLRSVRELLTNILKHSKADKATVLLEHSDGAIRVTVKDNGIGFMPEQVLHNVGPDGGLGLFSVEERLSDFGGSLVIDSKVHQGTTIVMMVPYLDIVKEAT
jgi:PAS domain S-box-containing protein